MFKFLKNKMLLGKLRHKDSKVRLSALNELAKLKDKSLCDTFVRMLGDNDIFIRKRAASELGVLGESRSIEPISQAFQQSKNEDFCYSALYALIKLGMGADKTLALLMDKLKEFDAIDKLASGTCVCVKQLGTPAEAIPVLLLAMGKTKKESTRKVVARSFSEFEHKAVQDQLRKASQQPDSLLRAGAIEGLSQIKAKECLGIAETALCDPEAIVRAAAIQAIEIIKSTNSNETLVGLLADTNKKVRWNAAKAVGALKVCEAIPLLTKMLETEESPKVVERVAMSLSSLDAKSAASSIQAALQRMKAEGRRLSKGNPLEDGTMEIMSACTQLEFAWKKLGVQGYH